MVNSREYNLCNVSKNSYARGLIDHVMALFTKDWLNYSNRPLCMSKGPKLKKAADGFHRVAVVDYITNACPFGLRSLALLQWSWKGWRVMMCQFDKISTAELFFIFSFYPQISSDVFLKKVKHITWQLHNKTWGFLTYIMPTCITWFKIQAQRNGLKFGWDIPIIWRA